MREIQLHFTEGFAGETVRVLVGGRDALLVDGLQTDNRKSLARIVRLSVADDAAEMAMELAGQTDRIAVRIASAGLAWIVVSLEAGKLRATPLSAADLAREPRGYG